MSPDACCPPHSHGGAHTHARLAAKPRVAQEFDGADSTSHFPALHRVVLPARARSMERHAAAAAALIMQVEVTAAWRREEKDGMTANRQRDFSHVTLGPRQPLIRPLVKSRTHTRSRPRCPLGMAFPQQELAPLPGYSRHERLGSGAFGTVFRETELSKGAAVAVKYIPVHAPTLLARELRAMHAVKHRGVVRFYGAALHGSHLAVVMEFVASPPQLPTGANLLDFVNAQPPVHGARHLTENQARVTLYQVLDALSYIHARNIVHRDLKCVARSSWSLAL